MPGSTTTLLLFAAATPTGLDALVRSAASELQNGADLGAVAFTLHHSLQNAAYRRAVVADIAPAAIDALTRAATDRGMSGHAPVARRVAFLFPGGGAQQYGMGRELYATAPVFRAAVDVCADGFVSRLGTDVREVICAESGRSDRAADLDRPAVALPALFATEYALARLWISWAVRPAALLGHSLGEYVAATIGGAVALDDAIALVAERSRLAEQLPPGAMLSVAMSPEALASLLPASTSIAAVNAPRMCVVSGPPEGLAALEGRLQEHGIPFGKLQLAAAGHSALIDALLDRFAKLAESMPLQAPVIPCVSNVTGTWLSAADVRDRRYWVRHVRHTVRFADGVGTLLADPSLLLLEVGPGRALSALARMQPGCRGRTVLASAGAAGRLERAAIARSAARLWVAGASLDWTALWPEMPAGFSIPALERACEDAARDIADTPVATGPAREREDVMTPLQQRLAAIWQDLLGVDRVGPRDDFYELGGHSLLATQLVTRVRESSGVELPLSRLFELSTVASMAECVEELAAAPSIGAVPPIVPLPRDGALPLSFAQERLWFLDQLQPGNPFYNKFIAIRLAGPLDTAALEAALREVVARHETLRSSFPKRDGRPRLAIAPVRDWTVPVTDLSALPAVDVDRAIDDVCMSEMRRAFDLAAGPPFRARLLRVSDTRHVLLFGLHHIVGDRWSVAIFARELEAFYNGRRSGRPPAVAALPVQYVDYAAWQRDWLSGGTLAEAIGYWKSQLGSLEPLDLPTDRPRPASPTMAGGRYALPLAPELAGALRDVSRREGATLFMTLLAAYAVLLGRYADKEDVAVGTVVANRQAPGTEHLIGLFINTLVLRTDLRGDPSFRTLLRRVRDTAIGAFRYQQLPFERLVEELQPVRDIRRPPLFQALFNLQNVPATLPRLDGLDVVVTDVETGAAMTDLGLQMWDSSEGLRGAFEYSTELFTERTIARMTVQFEQLLRDFVADPSRRLSSVSLAGAAAPPTSVRSASESAGERGVFERFGAHARTSPAAVAVTGPPLGGGPMVPVTYGVLAARAARWAARLAELEVGPEARVAICLDRSVEMIAAVLAVLQAGGAYVPIDPEYPRDRIRFMLEDSEAALVLTQSRLRDRLVASGAATPIVLDEGEWAANDDVVVTRPFPRVDPDNLAYIIYTSGSTGTPKGVGVTHRNIARLFDSTERWFHFAERDVWTMFHSLAFDFSVWEIWGALAHGGRLVVVPYRTSRSPAAFYELLAREQVTLLNQTPAAFRQLSAAEERASRTLPLALRLVIFGGEALDPRSLEPWFARHGDRGPLLVNMFGITETTVHVTYRPIAPEEARTLGRSAIGVPIPDLQTHVVDRYGQPAPDGMAGELLVGGTGLARGYLGRPDLTAERFVPDALSGAAGARVYRSGDRVRRHNDDDLEYIGRVDHQVKLRGFRIEPGEIEAVLAAHPQVREALVMRRDDGAEARLVGYVTARDEPPAVDALRRHARERLPEHMVPAAFVVVDAFPLTPHGKIDRRALPPPAPAAAAVGSADAPQTSLERAIAAVWREALQVSTVGLRDNFFDLGGHSLLMVRVHERLQAALGQEVSLTDMFEHPTISALASALGRRGQPVAIADEARGRAGKQRQALSRQAILKTRRREAERALGSAE